MFVEFTLGLLALVQLVGLLGVLGFVGRFVVGRVDQRWLGATRARYVNIQFFECASYGRLLSYFRYEVPGISVCVLFLLYDLDLCFFLVEVLGCLSWGWLQFGVFCCYLGFCVLGLWLDGRQGGWLWR